MTTSSATRDTQDFPHSFAPLLDRHYARPDFLKGLKTLMAAAQERIRNELGIARPLRSGRGTRGAASDARHDEPDLRRVGISYGMTQREN
jgi:hypothetical protein